MAINHLACSALATEQVVDRCLECFALDVPERHVYCCDGAHRHWPATPVRSPIQVLPDVFCLERIASDQARNYVIAKIARDCEFATIECGIAKAVDTFIGQNFKRDKVPSRRADKHLGVFNLHFYTSVDRFDLVSIP